jgi:DNA-binding CsgD family transcriptional regulator
MSDDIDLKIAELVQNASEGKIVQKQAKIVKQADLTKAPDTKKKVLQMKADGFTTEQIALAFGYSEAQIAYVLDEPQDAGTPEQILQDALKTLVSLVPLAESTYRTAPSWSSVCFL